MDKRERVFLACYLPVTWCLELCHGMMNTVLGPSQLYLAQNVGLTVSQINFVWTFGFLGYILGSFSTSAIIKTWLDKSWMKVSLMITCGLISGLCMICIPFITYAPLLFACRFLQFIGLAAMITADSSLLVYMMGAKKARPFIMALHALVGVGFLLATFLVKPFLPTTKGAACDSDRDSHHTLNFTSAGTESSTEIPETVASMIHWPFIIVGSISVTAGFVLLLVLILPLKMPVFEAETYSITDIQMSTSKGVSDQTSTNKRVQALFLCLIFVYYVLTCGIERIFQPMAYSFGLCGPLNLSPSDAVITDSAYNGGFMAGRILSILLALYLEPTKMIVTSLSMCIVTSAVLSFVAKFSAIGLYLGSFVTGFFLASEFGACVNWTAKKIDITGKVNSVFFSGCGIGGVVAPILSGYLFTSAVGPMSIMYLTFLFCLVQAIVFASAWILVKNFSVR